MERSIRIEWQLCWILVSLLMMGCAANPQQQLERTAKDWCLTIRASQVLPVYPLSQDIRPGDVFLVQVPLKRQTEIYEDKGFLPLDQLVARLENLDDYGSFYRDGYLDRPTTTDGAEASEDERSVAPVRAPRAAFPSYNFRVDRGTGLQLALPIQGVPVGLGLMGASSAAGVVTLADAYTYGLDAEGLLRDLDAWFYCETDGPEGGSRGLIRGQDCEVRDALMRIAQQMPEPIYLRVVTRVYLVSQVNVSLTNLDSRSAAVDAGAPQSVNLPDLSSLDPTEQKAAAEAYASALGSLSNALGEAGLSAPGGSVRFVQASQRAVSMVETFDRPLVVGYLGFDVLIRTSGELSPPIPSFAAITNEVALSSADTTPEQLKLSRYLHLARLDERGFEAVFALAAESAPRAFRDAFSDLRDAGAEPVDAFDGATEQYVGAVLSKEEQEHRLSLINQALEAALGV